MKRVNNIIVLFFTALITLQVTFVVNTSDIANSPCFVQSVSELHVAISAYIFSHSLRRRSYARNRVVLTIIHISKSLEEDENSDKWGPTG